MTELLKFQVTNFRAFNYLHSAKQPIITQPLVHLFKTLGMQLKNLFLKRVCVVTIKTNTAFLHYQEFQQCIKFIQSSLCDLAGV